MTDNKTTAATAREQATAARSLDGEYMRAETEQVLQHIEQAAARGLFSVGCNVHNAIVQARLVQRGFDVQVVSGGRDSYMQVSW